MRKSLTPFVVAIVTLAAGCTTMANETIANDEGTMPEHRPVGECNADGVQHMIGELATTETGQRLLQLTGATTLRWVPPRTAVTMDFRADRLTVSYDDKMAIDRITCG